MDLSLELNIINLSQLVIADKFNAYKNQQVGIVKNIDKYLKQYQGDLGWLNVKKWANENAQEKINEQAYKIREKGQSLVVIGIGGSNQAARAAIKALRTADDFPVVFSGNTISAAETNRAVDSLRNKPVFINVIAKNFETLEPGIGFRVWRQHLRQIFGEDYAKYVIVTGSPNSHLEDLSKQHGYSFFTFPEDVGGRYSAFTDVGLLPMAVAGIDIKSMVQGANDMQTRLSSDVSEKNIAFEYAAFRNFLYQNGFFVEMLSFFEPRWQFFAKWWVQLMGESEGKEEKGIFPVVGNFSEDLHSIGQYIQQGSPIMFETFIDLKHKDSSYMLQEDDVADNFDYLNKKDLWDINKAAYKATLEAHSKRFPCVELKLPRIDAYNLGQLFYFFQYSCFLSGLMLQINPFDQPGVEAYKQYMFEYLGKNN